MYAQHTKAGVAKPLARGPNSRLGGHWRAGYSGIYVIYAKKYVAKMHCSAIISIKSHSFGYTFTAFAAKCCCGGEVNKR